MAGKSKEKRRRKLPADRLLPAKRADWDGSEREADSFGPRGELVFARSSFSGPMPPPDLVAQYEEILPGAASFFFAALERQTAHRHSIEARVIDANISNEKIGMWLAFSLAFLMIACGTFLIYADKDPQGLALIGGTLVTLCGVFVYSRSQERKELKEKEPAGANDT
jgi:uncharacterized membrane protein